LTVQVDAVHAGAEGALHGVQAVVGPVVAEAAMGEDERARWPLDERAPVRRLVPEAVARGEHECGGEGAQDVAPQSTGKRGVSGDRCGHIEIGRASWRDRTYAPTV